MYDVIVDVDGVLLDIHTGMKVKFAKMGYRYDVENVYSYDFNTNLPNIPRFRRLPPTPLIYSMFADPMLFRSSPCDWDSIMYIRDHAARGVRFLIYTLSSNMDVQLVKRAMFSQWFYGAENISFLGVLSTKSDDSNVKRGILGRTVVEDCHINLRNYDDYTYKYLVDRPYNRECFNPDYADVFKKVVRCESTLQALELAVSQAKTMRLREIGA